jgi:endonuclease VIII
VFCGVGNVYRCEVLWVCEMSPFARVSALAEADAVRLVHVAAKLLRANLQSAARVTVPGLRGGLAVYGRTGQRCPRCAQSIEMRRAGSPARVLYWCPGCQLRLDPRDWRDPDDTPMDPHPAAAKFLADVPWRRGAAS